ncbi:MAG: hypothetical protein ACM3L8_02740 [Verrucomicrobiota bacterium]
MRAEGGSSRLETFVALMILLAGLLALASAQFATLTAGGAGTSARMRTAIDLAQAGIDRIQQMPWDAIRSSPPDGFSAGAEGVVPAFGRLPGAAGDSVSVHGVVYYRLWHVAADLRIPKLKTVTVLCCWREGRADWRHAALVTQIADLGRR